MNQRPSSPSVKPWRIGIGPAPTKLSQPGRSVSPSIGRPAGLGRSSTQTLLPCSAAASSTYRSVDERIDAAAEVLQVDQDRVEGAERLSGRAADLAVETEDRN